MPFIYLPVLFSACVFPYRLSAFRLLTDSSSDYNIYSLHLNMFVHALGKEPIIPHGHQSEHFSVYLSLGSHKLPVCLRGSPMKPQWQKLAKKKKKTPAVMFLDLIFRSNFFIFNFSKMCSR